ncbi:MAG: hypothetical protein AB1439_10335 [candidate division FCPU426 bacterium]
MTFTTRMTQIPWYVHTSEPSWVWKPPRRACNSTRPVRRRPSAAEGRGAEWKQVAPWQRPKRERAR